MRLTTIAHQAMAQHVQAGDTAIDATAGNGHDTVYLAHLVGDGGQVVAFDIQPSAIETTRARLAADNLDSRVRLVKAGHETLSDHMPIDEDNRITAIVFNLGYLPGSDKELITEPETTLAALSQSLDLLHPTGVISLLVYRGHAGGKTEHEQLCAWLNKQQSITDECIGAATGEAESDTPVLHLLRKG